MTGLDLKKVRHLPEAVIFERAVDSFRIREKDFQEIICVIVWSGSPIFLDGLVCSKGIPLLPSRTLTSTLFWKVAQFLIVKHVKLAHAQSVHFNRPLVEGPPKADIK